MDDLLANEDVKFPWDFRFAVLRVGVFESFPNFCWCQLISIALSKFANLCCSPHVSENIFYIGWFLLWINKADINNLQYFDDILGKPIPKSQLYPY